MQAILNVFAFVLAAAAAMLALPVVLFTVQVISACLARTGGVAPEVPSVRPPSRPQAAVLMPAHDEAGGIAVSIASVQRELAPNDRLLVVADNCSDETAAIARDAGAEVVERRDLERRGKGFALDFGVRHLAALPPGIVVVVDADCTVGPSAINRLVRRCAASGRPVQALYLMHSPAGAPLKTRIAEFAWVVKNEVRALGRHHLGLPCQLTGTGMAFPWALIRTAPLASGHIVEDLQLGLDLAAAGAPPEFCPAALVSSVFPLEASATASQRTRWEHGHLGMIAAKAPSLMWQALRHRQGALAAMVLDLCIPPLASLVLALCGMLLAGALLVVAGRGTATLLITGVSMSMLLGAVAMAWFVFARHIVTLREMAIAPAYAVGKISLYMGMLRRRQTEWVRTRRDDGRR